MERLRECLAQVLEEYNSADVLKALRGLDMEEFTDPLYEALMMVWGHDWDLKIRARHAAL